MNVRLADRVTGIQPSPTLAVSERARALRREGLDVVDLGGGDPDFATPQHICDAAAQAMARGETHYVGGAGIPELREAIARKLREDNGIVVDASAIIVTPGAKSGLFSAVLALAGPGDEVLVFDPVWVSYEPMATVAGARTVHVPLRPDDQYRITREAIEEQVTPRTKLMIVNSPNNPTGRVLTGTELEAIRAAAIEHDLLVFSDEIYEKIVYDDHQHVSLAALPDMAERTLTFNGLSKAYAMTGWRLGYVAGPSAVIKQIMKIHSHSVTCATSFAQYGGVAALEGPQRFIESMVGAWDRRRHLIASGLSAIAGIDCSLPEGAFYAFADVRGTGMTGQQVAKLLIDEAYVGVTSGDAFGEVSTNHIRLSFANSDEVIEKAIDRIAKVFRG